MTKSESRRALEKTPISSGKCWNSEKPSSRPWGVDQVLGGAWNLDSTLKVQERTFVNWCNLFLKSNGFEIGRLLDLQDGVCLLVLLEAVSGISLLEDSSSLEGQQNVASNWKLICNHLNSENIFIPETPDSLIDETRKKQLIAFIVWRIILRYQILDERVSTEGMVDSMTNLSEVDYKRASQTLLQWVHSKIADPAMRNFTSDWSNGIALCRLVNAIQPDTIPPSLYKDRENSEMNVRLATQAAEDELGIPELVAPYDIARCVADEKSLMTYIALFRSADRMIKRGIKTRTYSSDIGGITSESEDNVSIKDISAKKMPQRGGIPYRPQKCVAFGSGLRWGQVGKPGEFIVQLNGAQASDLSVSIECRPYDHRAALYKPELQIKPLDNISYIVRYTPTRPGEYVVSIFCLGSHIPNSPFRLSVQETVISASSFVMDNINISLDPARPPLTTELLEKTLLSEEKQRRTLSRDSAFVDDDSMVSPSDGDSPPTWVESDNSGLFAALANFVPRSPDTIQAFGSGLSVGEVGVVGSFNVYTPNSDKGPLSVCITCPAVSIPVPCVKTKLHRTALLHDVLYLPTEPGIYEIEVKWGKKSIPGSPFRLVVSEASENGRKSCGELERLALYRAKDAHNIVLYYSATSLSARAQQHKDMLEKLFLKECPRDRLLCIPMDLEQNATERLKTFRVSNTKELPFVFANDKFIGNYNDVMFLYQRGGLGDYLKRKSQTRVDYSPRIVSRTLIESPIK